MADLSKSIYNLQRFQILQTKINPATSNYIPDSYAYAWYDEVYPIMDTSDIHKDLKEHFKISYEQIDTISKYADQEWLEGRLYNFYEYERYFNVRYENQLNITRSTLLVVFKYIHINGGFDANFWSKLLEPMQHPTEAQSIIRKFDSDDIYLI
jgi:hypothetical protein